MHMPNFNAQVKKNSIAFDIDFENIKQNVLTTKKEDKSPKKIEVIPNVEDPNEEQKEQTLYKCPNCDRKFKREAYAKHVPICARVFSNNKNIENNKEKEKEKEKKNDKKGFNKRAKWENQSDELRAIIQQKRAEQAEDNHKKKELKIEIEEDKRHTANKIVITKIKPFEFIEQDIIDFDYGDEKVIGVIDNVSLNHYINTMVYFHNQIGITQHNFPDLWKVMKFKMVMPGNIRWCVENEKLYGVKIEKVKPAQS